MIPATRKQRFVLLLGLLPLFAVIIGYAVTWSFVWDEGFHLLAAQLIALGKTPYVDFCFPQTPLNAFLNAGILAIFGLNNWHAVHTFAGLYICIAVWLTADFVLTRLTPVMWRLPLAFTAAILFGMNVVVMQYGPTGQAYAFCLLMVVAAFRAAVAAVHSAGPWLGLLAGLLAGCAVNSTLLSAPVPLILLLWLCFLNQSASRIGKAGLFLVGCAVPCSPVLWLYLRAPSQTLFNVVRYQALFRRVNWGDANLRDFDTFSSWLAAPHAILLFGLVVAACIFLVPGRKEQDGLMAKNERREFLLAAAITGGLGLFIATAHPTFERYFIIAVPFLAMLGAVGLWLVGSRLASPEHSKLPAMVVITLSVLIWGRALFDERDDEHWSGYEEVSNKVAEITPIGARLYADELVYFLLQRTPPSGKEFSYAERLELPDSQEKLLHIISSKKLKAQVKAGQFATLQTCRDSLIEDFEPAKSFKHHEDVGDCDVFWGPASGNK